MLVVKNPQTGKTIFVVALTGSVELEPSAALRVLEAIKGSPLGANSIVEFAGQDPVRGDLIPDGTVPGLEGTVHRIGVKWPPVLEVPESPNVVLFERKIK